VYFKTSATVRNECPAMFSKWNINLIYHSYGIPVVLFLVQIPLFGDIYL